MNLTKLKNFLESLKLNEEEKNISLLVLKEIINRLTFLENVGLNYLTLNRSAETLSGGEAQRVALAKIILKDPPLILADEPTGNLDSKNGKEVMELLNELNKEGTTIVMVTHSKHDASFAHRVINLFDGSIVSSVNEFI